MTLKKLRRLRRKIKDLRKRGGIKPRELESIAKSLGRRLHPRGSEPNWVSNLLPQSRPISIPHHGELNRFTAGNILDALDADIDALEETLSQRQGDKDNGNSAQALN